jgi:hypothetical protein
MHSRIGRTLVVSLLALAPATAWAGSPLICFPMAIGDAPSLAWGSGDGWNTPSPGYDRARLGVDTMSLLAPRTPVLVRMETLRRAVIYASRSDVAARGLFEALRSRAAVASGGKVDPLAQFDLGYAVAAWREAGHVAERPLVAFSPSEDGYALVRQALTARGADPEMEYAAALMTRGRMLRGVSNEHLRTALGGATEGTGLVRTLAAHRSLWGDRIQGLPVTAATTR